MLFHAKPSHQPSLSPNDRIPTKQTLSPISPAYAQVLRNIYKHTSYSNFQSSLPQFKTRTLVTCLNEKRTREPSTTLQRRGGEEEVNLSIPMSTYTTDLRGILPGRKVQAHGFKEICNCSRGQESDSDSDSDDDDDQEVPGYSSVKRKTTKSHLYPQYNSSKGPMFKQRRLPPPLSDKKLGMKTSVPLSFEPFLLRTFSDSSITQGNFPAPYNAYCEHAFSIWFAKRIKSMGIGAEFGHMRLDMMRQQNAKQRREEEAEARRLQDILAEELKAEVEGRKALVDRIERDFRRCGLAVPERVIRVEPVTAQELEIREHLRRIAAERKARKEASRVSKRQAREAREENERREERELMEETKRREERSFMGRLKKAFTW